MKNIYFDVEKCLGCKSCELACAISHSVSKELEKMIKEKDKSLPRIKITFSKDKNYPMSCRHCKDPKCVEACMAAAISKDEKTGQILYDEDKCVGCWMCVMVCPYGAIRPNKKVKIPVRCDLCTDIDEPQCVKACPVKAVLWVEEEELEQRKYSTT